MKWSEYQQAIFKNVKEGDGNLVVQALAGSGKTATLIESLKHIPYGAKTLLTAFNKKTADELRKRCPEGISIFTIHGLGLKAVSSTFKNVKIDLDKTETIIENMIGSGKDKADLRNGISKTVSLAKASLAHSDEEIDDLIDLHDMEAIGVSRDEQIGLTKAVMNLCKAKTSSVCYDDMIFLCNVLKVKVPKYNYIMVDECQDISVGQANLILQTLKKKTKVTRGSRVFVLGDPFQAIYSWRGASSNSMEVLQEKLNAKVLPLSISYRSSVKVAEQARKYVPNFECAPNAQEGSVNYITEQHMLETAQPGCFILSRVNAPILGLALKFLRRQIPCNIQGRDLGMNLIHLLDKSKAKTIEDLIVWVKDWQVRETARMILKKRDPLPVQDKAQCILNLSEDVKTIEELYDFFKKIFSDMDDQNKVILSTTHRVKGLERDTVYMLTNTFRSDTQEELNIKYVAITRAKRDLYYVSK